jgi:circadian clock protein KaiB
MMSQVCLQLFVNGKSTYAERAIRNLRRICEDDLAGRYELTIIDVLERPDLAEAKGIVATPTLIKELPPPSWRLVGDLSDTPQVRFRLGL